MHLLVLVQAANLFETLSAGGAPVTSRDLSVLLSDRGTRRLLDLGTLRCGLGFARNQVLLLSKAELQCLTTTFFWCARCSRLTRVVIYRNPDFLSLGRVSKSERRE